MNADVINKLDALVNAWVIDRYKATNPTGTYTDSMLTELAEEINSWIFQWYSAEDKGPMGELPDANYEEWVEENIDRLAEEDLEYQISIRGAQNYKKHKLRCKEIPKKSR